jgi:hypothetical protein
VTKDPIMYIFFYGAGLSETYILIAVYMKNYEMLILIDLRKNT